MEVCLKEKATAQGEVGEKAAEESKMVSKKKKNNAWWRINMG